VKAPLVALALTLVGCPPTRDADWPDGCRDADLAHVAALHAAELVAACEGHASLEECPLELREPVDAKYDAAYQRWEDCR
jgi:hypothetical protein